MYKTYVLFACALPSKVTYTESESFCIPTESLLTYFHEESRLQPEDIVREEMNVPYYN